MVGPELVDFWVIVAKLIELIADTSPESWSLLSEGLSDVSSVFSIISQDLGRDSSTNLNVAHPPKTEGSEIAHQWPEESELFKELYLYPEWDFLTLLEKV